MATEITKNQAELLLFATITEMSNVANHMRTNTARGDGSCGADIARMCDEVKALLAVIGK